MNNNKIYNIIRVSDLTKAEVIKNLVFFGYDPTKPVKEQSVQIPFSLFQAIFDTKQDNLIAGDLVELKPNTDGTVTINVIHDDTKQNALKNTDGTIVLKDNTDGTTDIKAVFTENVQTYSESGTKVIPVTSQIVRLTTTSQLMIVGIDSDLNSITFINESNLSVYFGFDADSSNNKLKKTDVSTIFELPKYRIARFFKSVDGWLLMKETAYFPDLSDSSRKGDYNILTNPDGSSKIEEIQNIHEIDESVTSLTATQLNSRYPDAVGGFTLLCNGVMYIKSSNYDDKWQSLILNTVN